MRGRFRYTLAKIDIEGQEEGVIPDLFRLKSACAVDEFIAEWHGTGWKTVLKKIWGQIYPQSNCTRFNLWDDETYSADPFPLGRMDHDEFLSISARHADYTDGFKPKFVKEGWDWYQARAHEPMQVWACRSC